MTYRIHPYLMVALKKFQLLDELLLHEVSRGVRERDAWRTVERIRADVCPARIQCPNRNIFLCFLRAAWKLNCLRFSKTLSFSSTSSSAVAGKEQIPAEQVTLKNRILYVRLLILSFEWLESLDCSHCTVLYCTVISICKQKSIADKIYRKMRNANSYSDYNPIK